MLFHLLAGRLMPLESANAYDLVPYESHPFNHSHPSRLASIGTLFGMRPIPIHRCRVLEVGYASGGNLIPMAIQLPNSHFLGVDLSQRQIDQGRAVISSLGLRNIELRHANIQAIGAGDGSFDYFIAHGVFSWVPTEVQEAMFRIAAENLHPQGIAFISYNTYPGWHLRGLIREMMRYHAANYATANLKTRYARGLLDFLAGSVPQDGSAFTALLRQEIDILRHHAEKSVVFRIRGGFSLTTTTPLMKAAFVVLRGIWPQSARRCSHRWSRVANRRESPTGGVRRRARLSRRKSKCWPRR